MKPFEERYIAHRGLFDNESDAPENSLPAFKKAVEAGYGIELDIQRTTDNHLVVFHDGTLKRMCGVDKMVTDCTLEELQQYSLLSSGQKIPLFDEVLDIVDGKVPLIVEIKSEGDWKDTTIRTAKRLDSYKGIYCIESFHPLVIYWVRKNRPDVIRGQLSTNFFKDEPDKFFLGNYVLTNLQLNFLARPDFIAYNHKHTKQFSYTLCRKFTSVENVCWTIKNQEELDNAKKDYQVIIFDSFIPK